MAWRRRSSARAPRPTPSTIPDVTSGAPKRPSGQPFRPLLYPPPLNTTEAMSSFLQHKSIGIKKPTHGHQANKTTGEIGPVDGPLLSPPCASSPTASESDAFSLDHSPGRPLPAVEGEPVPRFHSSHPPPLIFTPRPGPHTARHQVAPALLQGPLGTRDDHRQGDARAHRNDPGPVPRGPPLPRRGRLCVRLLARAPRGSLMLSGLAGRRAGGPL